MKRRESSAQAHVGRAHQRQWPEEVLAELAIGDPGRALDPSLERQRIDEDRAGADELDVEGARVLQDHAVLDGHPVNGQRRAGSRLQLAEGPFERIRDEGNALGGQNAVGRIAIRSLGDLLVADEQAALCQGAIEPRRDQLIVIGRIRVIDLPQDAAVAPEHMSCRIAERSADRRRLTHEHRFARSGRSG